MINIMFAGNYKVFDGMLIASMSILKHCKEPIKAYILTMDLTDQNPEYKPINDEHIECLKKVYKQTNKENDVVKIDVGDLYKKEFENSPNKENFYTPYTFLRLFADQIEQLPDKIIYLDTDVMANGDISQLWNIDVTGYELAGVKDYYGRFFFRLKYPKYMNAGVFLFNLKVLRKTKMLNKAMKLCATKKIFLLDQTAINKYTQKRKILPRKFNEQHKLKKDTIIRHFAMTLKFFPKFKKQNIKPWNIEGMHKVLKCHEFDDILNKYLEMKKNNFKEINKWKITNK